VMYQDVRSWYEKIRLVTKKNKLAIFTREGKQLTDFKFDSLAESFDDYSDLYSSGKLFEVSNTDGKITPVTEVRKPENYEESLVFFEEPVAEQEEVPQQPVPQEFIDRITQNYELDSMPRFPIKHDGRAEIYQVYRGGKMGYYFRDDRQMMKPQYDALYELWQATSNTFQMIAVRNGKYGVIDEAEKVIIPFEFDKIVGLSPSFIYTTKQGKQGVWIFNTVYPPIKNSYDEIKFVIRFLVSSRWSFLVFKVRKNGQWGYVGENGVEFFE